MEAYKRGSHTVWDCKYHLVWVTKYRYPVLGGDVGNRCRELLRETAEKKLNAARALGLVDAIEQARHPLDRSESSPLLRCPSA